MVAVELVVVVRLVVVEALVLLQGADLVLFKALLALHQKTLGILQTLGEHRLVLRLSQVFISQTPTE